MTDAPDDVPVPEPAGHLRRPIHVVRDLAIALVISLVLWTIGAFVVDVWGNVMAVLMMLVVPSVTAIVVARRSRWWVRILLAVANIVLVFVVFVILMSIVFSSMEFAAVG